MNCFHAFGSISQCKQTKVQNNVLFFLCFALIEIRTKRTKCVNTIHECLAKAHGIVQKECSVMQDFYDTMSKFTVCCLKRRICVEKNMDRGKFL